MKKYFYSMLMLAMSAFAFTACEDVPEPYDIPGSGSGEGGSETVITPSGSGTQTDPYNVAAALQLIEGLAADVNTETLYVKGKIVSIKEVDTGNYGNATYYISDDGTSSNQLYIFRSLGLGNKKFTPSSTPLAEGDEVVVCGQFTNYMGNTPETVTNKSYLYSHNGKTVDNGGTDTPTPPTEGTPQGDGTLENPFNAVAANNYAAALEAGAVSDKDVYIKGKIVSIREKFSTQYGNASFYISEDGTDNNKFYVFRTLYLNNVKYTEGTQPQVGDDVIICGKVTNYMGNTPETAANESYLYSLTSNGGGGNEGGEDTPAVEGAVLASSWGLENAAELSTNTLTMPDGATLTFDAGGGNTTPKYYKTGEAFRMYPKNSVQINAAKTIKSVTFVCDVYQGTTYNASGDITATPGTVSVSNEVVTINDINSNSVTITNASTTTGAPSQIRMKSIAITYAE